MKRIILLVCALVSVFVAIIIGTRNTQTMTVNYLIAQTELQTSTFMMIMLLLGFIIGLLSIVSKYLALKLKLRLLQRKLSKVSQGL